MAAMGTEARGGGGMDPTLYKAATQGNVASLRELLVKDVKILNTKTPQDNTALHLTTLHGHPTFAREVLAASEEMIVARNADGDTALHLAAKTGTLKVAELLIGMARAWPDEPDPEDTLLKSPLVMTNRDGNNPLHEAVRNRKTAVALALLDADPLRGHDLNERLETPLDMAAREGLVQVVQKILNYTWVGQEFLPSFSLSGTVLHHAVLGTHNRTIVEMLLEKRPDLIDHTDSNGNNALHYAALKNNSHVVELLLNRKTQVAYSRNKDGKSPLHVAAQHGSTAVIKALLRHCSDVSEMVDGNGRNAFHTSVIYDKVNALRCLLHCVRPAKLLNRVDSYGDTPLHLAAKMSHFYSVLTLFRDRRVDPCIRDRHGQTARSLMERKVHTGETDTHEVYLWQQLQKQECKRCRNKEQLPPTSFPGKRRALNEKDFDKVVDAYFLAATLIATVTFASTFTMPGGYDQTNGTALHGHNTTFKVFVVSNTVAMCSSILVIFLLIWARQE